MSTKLFDFTDAVILDYTPALDITDQVVVNNGIDADQIATMCQAATNKTVSIKKSKQVISILKNIGYAGDSYAMRLQKIVNASILELYLLTALTPRFNKGEFKRKSGGFYNGKKESGVDFHCILDKKLCKLEAKVYGSLGSMDNFKDHKTETFHEADLVCCYVLTSSPHWQWLYRTINDTYVNLGRNPNFIAENTLSSKLNMCRVTESEETFEITLQHVFNK